MSEARSVDATLISESYNNAESAKRHNRNNLQMVQNIFLIWLDSNIDQNNSDCQNTLSHLAHVASIINVFTDAEKCIRSLGDVTDAKASMIISGSLGRKMMPRLHVLSQMDSIFILCGNKSYHEGWAKEWPKIKGVFTDIQPICVALKQAAQLYEQNAMSMTIMAAEDTLPDKILSQLDPSFMYTQIMKEILLTIRFGQEHIDEFIQYSRKVLTGNVNQLKYVEQLATTYRAHTPIWWYTVECFLHSMLNRALRTMDTNVMIKLGFLISDIHRQIQELHQKQFGSYDSSQKFIVYRGQGMDKNSVEKMMKSKGGLLSFNCFLSTSKNHDISFNFAEGALTNPQMMGVVFVMTVNAHRSNTPFASVMGVGCYGEQEQEILFSMHTVFRIGRIKSFNDNPRLLQVELTMTNDKDTDLCQLIDRIREETFPKEDGWFRLALVLKKMGESANAQQLFEVLLKRATENSARARIHHQIGIITGELGKYREAITYYVKSIEFEKQQTPQNYQTMADLLNDIGWAYDSMDNYAKAVECYEKTLRIRKEIFPTKYPDLASTYNRIGVAYYHLGEHSMSLSYHEKTLVLRKQYLPSTHPDLAASYDNIGLVYFSKGRYVEALSSHGEALAISQKSLPPTHPDLAASHNNIGRVYSSMRDYPKALSSHEKALAIRQQSLPSTHPDLAASYNNIGCVYLSMGDYVEALSSFRKALAIFQQSLPSTRIDWATTHHNMGRAHEKMGSYSEALSYYECAIDIAQHSSLSNHSCLQKWRKDFARMKKLC